LERPRIKKFRKEKKNKKSLPPQTVRRQAIEALDVALMWENVLERKKKRAKEDTAAYGPTN